MSPSYIFFLTVLVFVTCTSGYACSCGSHDPQCPENEEFIKCGSLCQETCLTRGQNCTRVGLGGITCEDRCYCKEGYVRACTEDGPCIPCDLCAVIDCAEITPEPPIICSRPYEHYECGSACQTECRTLGEECPIINIACNHGCYCDAGFARACSDTDPCIPVEMCQLIRCAGTTTSKPLIDCRRPYEHYECGSACQTECKTLGQECPIKNIQCNHGCYCDIGYARDENGRCIRIEECPESSTCE